MTATIGTVSRLEEGLEPFESKSVEISLQGNASPLKMIIREGLSFSQAKICLALQNSGPLTFESISELLDLEKAEVYRAVLRLEKLGFVNVKEIPSLF